jgi:hypothetical protein
MDINDDGKLTLLDLTAMAVIYGKTCGDCSTDYKQGCGGKNVNPGTDCVISLIDLTSLAVRYGENKSCKIY